MTTKINGGGSLFLTEKASADADVAGDGQVWVGNETPNILKYTDDAGTDTLISKSLTASQATTSGTAIDFTGIPSGCKEIIVTLTGVSTGGSSDIYLQLGDAGGIEATGYLAVSSTGGGASGGTTGFPIANAHVASDLQTGVVHLVLHDAATFTWTSFGIVGYDNLSIPSHSCGRKSLSAELTQIRLTSASADTFDAGAVSIQYS